MTTKQMKKKYNQAPDEWIALWSMPIGWINHGKWVKSINPAFNEENYYKLISVKHKDILDAYLADNSVEIEFYLPYFMCTDGTELEATWEVGDNFIENYSPELTYRLKEKEDVKTLSKQSSQSISSELSDSSNTSDIGLPNINNFQDYGFTADFAGEILKEVGDRYIGYILNKDNKATAITWEANGVSTLGEPDTVWQGFRENYNTNLTQIKQHWYGYPENFPAMLIRDTEEHMGYIWVDNKEQFIKRHRQGFRLITKAERDRLFCKE